MNILTTFYHTQSGEQALRVPIAFDIIRKPEFSCDIESKKFKRKSPVNKNELMLNIVVSILHGYLRGKVHTNLSRFIRIMQTANLNSYFGIRSNNAVKFL
jgi:hypothetical protein